jgi:hypothetical protein
VFCRTEVCTPEQAAKSDPANSILNSDGFEFWNKVICYSCADELEEIIKQRRRYIERLTEQGFDWVVFTKRILKDSPKYIFIFAIVSFCFILLEFIGRWIKKMW